MSDQRQLILLGPQPRYASLQAAVSRLGLRGPVALITAGWETEELEDQDLQSAIGIKAINLRLFVRTEQLFHDDPELIQLLKARQDELRHLREVYNDRLDHLLSVARKVIRRKDDLIDLDAERESSIEMVRQLDQQYLQRTSEIIDSYEQRLQIADRPLVAANRQEIRRILDQVDAILISGGHVAVILNRLKIFGILETHQHLPVIAWSGGTMALSHQIVFFHDSPPQGPGSPEVLRAGMSLFQDVLPLPDARSRLNLDDRARVELFARRFNRFQCVIFDEHTILENQDDQWRSWSDNDPSRMGAAGNLEGFHA